MYLSRRVCVLLLSMVALLSGCASLQPAFENPTVTVSSFRALPSQGLAPQFEIGLHVVNPNRTALKLEGVSYTVMIEGHRILTGVANELPVIEAYGEGDITLRASASLLSGIKLIADLMSAQKDRVSYELDARLDVGRLLPRISVKDSGEVSLTGRAS